MTSMPSLPISASRRLATIVGFALAMSLALSALFTSAAAAAPPAYKGASNDGEIVFFESDEQLVPGDTDQNRDLFERSFDPEVGDDGAYVTRELSVGPTGGNDAYNALFEKASADGSVVFFSTEESLVAGDTDRETDVYVRYIETGTIKVVSRGATTCAPACGNATFDAGFAGATADGGVAFIVTAERLDPVADSDGSVDVYARDLATEKTNLVSAGAAGCQPACGNGEHVATLRGVAAGGSTAYFATAEPLAAADLDTAIDIYARTLPEGPTTLVSAGDPACSPCGSSNASAAIFAAGSADGSRVFFATNEGLVSADKDGANDIYQRSGGVTSLVSAGSANQPASFAAAPGDGSRVFFLTAESLVGGADTNGSTDIYMWQGGSPQLITSGRCCGSTFGAASADAGAVFFTTTESLAAADVDLSADVYAQAVAGGSPVLASAADPACPACGNGEAAARFNRASSDGLRVFFTSDEVLSGEDLDDDDDIYVRDLGAGETSLSTPASGPCPTGDCDATFVDASGDGAHVLFQTLEAMAGPADGDTEADIYERADDADLDAEVTRLVSTGNLASLELGPDAPLLEGTTPGSPGISTEPAIFGSADAGSSIKLYANSGCSGEPVATGSAEELADPGIGVTVEPGSSSQFRATAEADGFTSLCSDPIAYTQQTPEPPDPPSDPPPSGGGSGDSGSAGSGGGDGKTTAPTVVRTHDGVPFVAPLTRITFAPASKTRQRRPVFRFDDGTGQPGTRFSCKLDKGRWKPCGSPTKTPPLKPGRHVFRVTAVNAVGMAGERPASRSFKVVRR